MIRASRMRAFRWWVGAMRDALMAGAATWVFSRVLILIFGGHP